jgi:chaperonin cofactor prefoldin
MQDMKEKFNKVIEILKDSNQNSTNENSQIKKSVENLINRLDQAEDRLSGLEDNVDELEYLDNNRKNERK